MEHGTLLLLLAILLGFYVSWNIGANDVANAMGTSVGSGALTLKRAVILAAILEFCGAFFFGSHVSETIESGVIDPGSFALEPLTYVLGMLASLLAVGVWLQIASFFGWPVSTTHSIIGAIMGFGLFVVGAHAIHWGTLLAIVLSWIISPLIGGVIAFLMFIAVRSNILYAKEPLRAAKRMTPFLVFLVFAILSLVLLYDGLEAPSLSFSFWEALGIASLIGLLAGAIAALFIRCLPTPKLFKEEGQPEAVSQGLERALRHLHRAMLAAKGPVETEVTSLVHRADTLFAELKRPKHYETLESELGLVEKLFAYLQILSACFMAFAHGANDVANAMGPLAGIMAALRTNSIAASAPIPLWVLALGGVGIIVGLATWGWRVIATVGKKITELTPTRGFAAEFSAATTILVASRLGLPLSTTHTLVGAVLGVGLARGISAINLTIVRDIVISWIITVPAGAILAILFYHLLRLIFA